MSARALMAGAVLLLLAACANEESKPAGPKWSGAKPSEAGQAALRSLEGRGLPDDTSAFGGGRWVVGPWGVVSNPRNGKGAVVKLTQDGRTAWLPVESDGDVADLWLRVTWTEAPVKGEMSDEYRAAWARRMGGR